MPVPAHLIKITSQTEIWDALFLSRIPIHAVSRKMNVSLSVAKEGLAEAASRLRQRHRNCLRAEEVLTASGAAKQQISRRAWDDVALGLKAA